jgi:hypothetical protein
VQVEEEDMTVGHTGVVLVIAAQKQAALRVAGLEGREAFDQMNRHVVIAESADLMDGD